MDSIMKNCSSLRVSSVLKKNAKEFGKQYMIDDCDDTCWNSDQGSPQWVEVNFPLPVTIEELHIQFQGGFAGKESWIEAKCDGELKKISFIYPEDNNALQAFVLPPTISDCFRIIFTSSTDFFGRIIIYKLDVKGKS